MISLELMQCIVEGVESGSVEIGAPCKVTEVKKDGDALDDIWMHKTINGR